MKQPSFLTNYEFNQTHIANLNQLIDNLVADYSKLLVIRVDFSIQRESSQLVNHHFMNEAFIRLRNNLRHNQLFEHYITYVAKLEYGADKTWHYHVIFFFNGQKVNRDILLSQQIGEYWVNTITKGIGSYHSCNMNQNAYISNGIGMVHYDDYSKINSLKMAASYLTKLDCGIADKGWKDQAGKCVRAFRMGEYTPTGAVRGRPRHSFTSIQNI